MAIRWDKFTVKAQEAVQRANELAARMAIRKCSRCTCSPLLADKEGMIPSVLEKIGCARRRARREAIAAIEQLPKVGGACAGWRFERANQIFDRAFKEAANFKDDYVSTEHLLLAITRQKSDAAQQLLAAVGATHDAILKALTACAGPSG